jgi:hypothetical protein
MQDFRIDDKGSFKNTYLVFHTAMHAILMFKHQWFLKQ